MKNYKVTIYYNSLFYKSFYLYAESYKAAVNKMYDFVAIIDIDKIQYHITRVA